MKKLVLALLLVGMMGLTACGGNADSSATESSSQLESSSEVSSEVATPEPTEEPTPEPTPSPTPAPTPTPAPRIQNWELIHTVDEFGDETSDTVLRSQFTGEFSNSVSKGNELIGFVFASQISETSFNFAFRLVEYGRVLATYSESDKIELKTKVGDDVNTYSFTGMISEQDLYISLSSDDPLYCALYEGKDVKCVITVENTLFSSASSTYNFTLQGGNFSEILQQG